MPLYDAGTAGIKVKPNLSGFKRELETGLKGIDASVSVRITADLTEATADINRWRQQQEANPVQLRVRVNTGIASAELAAWRQAQESRWVSQKIAVDKTALKDADRDVRRTLGKMPGFSKVSLLVAVDGAVGAVAALLSVANAASQVAKAGALLPAIGFGGLAGIAAVGTGVSGIGGVFSAMKAETAAAGSAASSAADQVHEVAQAQWNLEAAQRGVTSANRDAEDAQQDLSDAYRDSSRNLRDMNNQLNEQKLAAEESSLAVEDAAERLDRVMNDPTSSGRDKKKAQVDYEQAIARLQDERNATVDLQADTDAANAKGVRGSKEVVDATQKVADSQQAQADALHRVEEAQYALQKAMEGDAAGGAADKLAKAMEKLSPNAKEFVTDIRALGPAWTDLRQASQDSLFEGLGDSVTNLADAQLPILKAGLSGISSEINNGVRGSIGVLSSDMARLDFAVSLGNVRKMFAGLSDAAVPFTDAMIKTTTVGTQFLPAFGQAVSDASTKFDTYITKAASGGVLKQNMQEGIDAAKDLGTAVYNVGSITASVFRAAGAGHDGLKTFNDLAGGLADKLKSVEGQDGLISFFEKGRDALAQWEPMLGMIPGLLTGVSDGIHTWAGVIVPVVSALGNIMAAFPGLVQAAVFSFLAFKTVAPVIGLAQIAMAKLIATTAGTTAAAAGAGRLTAAGAGLLGVIGNPYVIAAAAAAGATYMYIDSMNKGSDAVQRYKTQAIQANEASDGLTKALQMSGGAIDSGVIDKQTESLDQFHRHLEANAADTPSAMDDLFGGIAFGFSKISGGIGEGVVANDRFRESAARAANEAKTSYDELGLSSDDMVKKLYGTEPAFEKLLASVDGTSNGGEVLIGKLKDLRAQWDADRMEAYYAAAEAFTAIGDEAGMAASQITALTDAMAAQNSEANAIDDARLKAADAQANLTQGIDKEKPAPVVLDDGSLDFNNANGRTLYGNMKELQDGYAALIASNQRLARERGDTDEEAKRSTKEVADAYIETARQQLIAAGIPLPAVDLLLQRMDLAGQDRTAKLDIDTTPATTALDNLQLKIDAFEKQDIAIPLMLQVSSYVYDPNNTAQHPGITPYDPNARNRPLGDVLNQLMVPGNADGGFLPTTGPGTEITDGILAVTGAGVPVARVDGGEHITNRKMSQEYAPELTAINAGTFPKFQDGGVLPGGAPVADSMWAAAKAQFPDATLNSATRPGDSGFHGRGMAVDLGGPMQAIADWIFTSMNAQTAQLIWGPGPLIYNVGGQNITDQGQLRNQVYAGDIGGHYDHVHWAAEQPVVSAGVPPIGGVGVDPTTGAALNTGTTTTSQVMYPQAPLPGVRSDEELSKLTSEASVDSANQERNKVYADPASTDADKQAADIAYQQAQNQLQDDVDTTALSVPGMFSKAGAILGTGLLSFFGLENSVLSEGNVYNKAVQDVAKEYGYTGTELPNQNGYTYQPKNLPATVTTYTPAAGVAQPGAAATTSPALAALAMPADVPEGGISAGSPGAKQAFWNEWQHYGWTGEEWLDTLRLYNGESGWNADAQNPSSTAYGVAQFLDSTWATVGESKSSDPAVQARAAGKYLASGNSGSASWATNSPSGAYDFWMSQNPHWYDQGGVANGIGLMAKNVIAPERILSPRQTETFDSLVPLLESLNRTSGWSGNSVNGAMFESRQAPAQNVRPTTEINFNGGIQALDPRAAIREADRQMSLATTGMMAALP